MRQRKRETRLPKYQCLLWDWNGTLMDDAWLCTKVINQVLRKYDKPEVTLEQYRDIFDFPVEGYYKKLGFDFSKHPFEVVGTEFILEYKKQWKDCQLHSGAYKVLQLFFKAGLSQSIISAADNALLNDFVHHYHVAHFFNSWNGLHHHYATSKVEIARQLMSTIDIHPSQVLMIGDTKHDYTVATEIGVDCVLFTGGHQSIHKLAECKALLINSLKDVVQRVGLILDF